MNNIDKKVWIFKLTEKMLFYRPKDYQINSLETEHVLYYNIINNISHLIGGDEGKAFKKYLVYEE